ncbi:MAG: hypothetical protein KGV51_01040 [Moraxellaceae bacterium]|nr:hypothetical protein [Moraxellaceae bacterium]
MSLPRCGHPTEKIRIMSDCNKPLHTKVCNSEELAQAITQAINNSNTTNNTEHNNQHTALIQAIEKNTEILKQLVNKKDDHDLRLVDATGKKEIADVHKVGTDTSDTGDTENTQTDTTDTTSTNPETTEDTTDTSSENTNNSENTDTTTETDSTETPNNAHPIYATAGMSEQEFIQATIDHLIDTGQGDTEYKRDDVVAYPCSANRGKDILNEYVGVYVMNSPSDEFGCLSECSQEKGCFAKNYKIAFGREMLESMAIGSGEYWGQ